jgi:hypothetical protein
MANNKTDMLYGEGGAQAAPKRASKAVNIAVICAMFVAALAVWAVMSPTFDTSSPKAEAVEVKTAVVHNDSDSTQTLSSKVEVKTAVVHNDSGIVCELPLSTDTTYEVTSELGANTVVVEGGEVYVAEADCPGHDCMSQGRISDTSQTIVCLPHKMWIEITSDTQDAAFDAIGS